MIKEYSCGAVLFCHEDNTRKYVLVKEASGSYGFPKGHKENNETDIQTAQREIYEETGIKPQFLPKIKRTIRYKLSNSTEKEVTFFAAKYENQKLYRMDNTILDIKKLTLEEALQLLRFSELKNILIEMDYMIEQMEKNNEN